ncbi:MAG: tRNA (adenosine(37)-N6)-dimethylallyltransferase MiaA, partial [Acidobacteria bacterium]|nr:tRNA (adenosine(37)-N6)-dimethylallyltransferase MiaA [Acidobacteriota bacterium]
DPTAAQKIHPHDAPKLIRAIEVCLRTRRPMSAEWGLGREALRGFRILRIGLNPARALLYERINRRVEAMFAAGLIEETRALFERYGRAAHALGSMGYRQVLGLLRGDLDRQRTITAVQQAHRNYAKRQMTWFRREPDVVWIEGFGDDPGVQEQASSLLARSLI